MGVSNVSESQFVYDLIKKSMEASNTRSQVISNNIANVNTANYKRYYVNFEDTLKNRIDNLSLKKTNSKHLDDGNSFGNVSVEQDTASSMNSDGNNVDIDTEMANQAKNTLMYEALINQANNRISSEKLVINGGGN